MIKINRPHGRLTIPTTHAGAEVSNETTLLFKVCQLFLVLAANIVTWLGVVGCDKYMEFPFTKDTLINVLWNFRGMDNSLNLERCTYTCNLWSISYIYTTCTYPPKAANFLLWASCAVLLCFSVVLCCLASSLGVIFNVNQSTALIEPPWINVHFNVDCNLLTFKVICNVYECTLGGAQKRIFWFLGTHCTESINDWGGYWLL